MADTSTGADTSRSSSLHNFRRNLLEAGFRRRDRRLAPVLDDDDDDVDDDVNDDDIGEGSTPTLGWRCCRSSSRSPRFSTAAISLGSRVGTGQSGIRVLALRPPPILPPIRSLAENMAPRSLTLTPARSPINRRGGRRVSIRLTVPVDLENMFGTADVDAATAVALCRDFWGWGNEGCWDTCCCW